MRRLLAAFGLTTALAAACYACGPATTAAPTPCRSPLPCCQAAVTQATSPCCASPAPTCCVASPSPTFTVPAPTCQVVVTAEVPAPAVAPTAGVDDLLARLESLKLRREAIEREELQGHALLQVKLREQQERLGRVGGAMPVPPVAIPPVMPVYRPAPVLPPPATPLSVPTPPTAPYSR